MNDPVIRQRAEVAWNKIVSLGGDGIWNDESCNVSFSRASVSDADMVLFVDLPFIQTLDLSHTGVTDKGLAVLDKLPGLKNLIVTDTKISSGAVEQFRLQHPSITVTA